MRAWDANRLARAAGARLVFRPDADALPGGAQDAAPPGPLRVSIDSRSGRPRRSVRRAARRTLRRRGVRRPGAAGRRVGRAGGARARACRRRDGRGRGVGRHRVSRRGARGPQPAHRPAVARALVADGAARRRHAGRGDHRLDRQDLDQGHPRGTARLTPAGELRARRTSTPRSACRSRSSPRPPAPRRWCWRWRCAAQARSRS